MVTSPDPQEDSCSPAAEQTGARMSKTAAAGSGGRVIFTGPDGMGDYRPRSGYFQRYIGEGSTSPEITGDLQYLTRPAPGAPPLTPRGNCVGQVGWGWEFNQQLNRQTLWSNMQIKKTDVRVALEERWTHKFQNHRRVEPRVKRETQSPAGGAVKPAGKTADSDVRRVLVVNKT